MTRFAVLLASALLVASCSAAEAELARMEDQPQSVPATELEGSAGGEPADEEQAQDERSDPPADTAPDDAPSNEESGGSDTPGEAEADTGGAEDPDEPATTVPVVTPIVIERYPHDGAAFTQGLEFNNGLLIESLGLLGESSRRQVEVTSGEVIGSAQLDGDQFGAGLTVVDTQLIQLTWQQGVAIVADLVTLIELGRFTYEGEGWGICGLDDGRLVMSNGSGFLTFRDPTTFEVIGDLEVTRDGETVANLNELECVGTTVYANVWLENDILAIDSATGEVTKVIDAAALVPDDLAPDDVLNGIAHQPETNTFFLTGKRWTVMYEVSFD